MFVLKKNSALLPPVHLGQNLDLTITEETPLEATNLDYDLNGDGKINSADYALLSSCLGKSPNTSLAEGKSCNKTDINKDGSINQQDMDLMTQKFSGQ